MAQLQSLGVETHSFNVSLAEQVGLAEAIILQHFYFWHKANIDNPDMTKDGRVWLFRSVKSICDDFGYLTPSKVKTAIDRLVSEGWILKGDYNSDRMKRVTWYSLADLSLSFFGGITIGENRQCICENNTTISDFRQCKDSSNEDNIISFTDIKEKKRKKINKKEKDECFEECWKLYLRKGSKQVAATYWSKLKDDERKKVKEHIPHYVSATGERKYQKDFERYLRARLFDCPVYDNGVVVYDPDLAGEYHPFGNTSIIYQSTTQRYLIISHPMFGIIDGYKDENRPNGATLYYQGIPYVWNKEKNEWIKEE